MRGREKERERERKRRMVGGTTGKSKEEVSLSRLNGSRWMQAEIRVGCCLNPLLSSAPFASSYRASFFVVWLCPCTTIVLHGFRGVYSATYIAAVQFDAVLRADSFVPRVIRRRSRYAFLYFSFGVSRRKVNFDRHRANSLPRYVQ